jgi:hypothetical protein
MALGEGREAEDMAHREDNGDFTIRGGVGATANEWQRKITFIKPQHDGRTAIVILSDKYFACFTHFVEGRTIACTAQGCKWCKLGKRVRWRYFIEVMTILTKRRGIVELGARAGKILEEALAKHGSLRGMMGLLERKGKGDNAQIVLTQLTQSEMDGLPAESDWLAQLLSLWISQHKGGDENGS